MNVIPFRPRSVKPTAHPQTASFVPGRLPIGIDLGTTHSVVSIVPPFSNPETLLYENSSLVPSVVVWDPSTHNEAIGQKAKFLEKSRTAIEIIKSSKRRMGQRHATYHSHGKTYHPEDVAQSIMKYLIGHERIQEDLNRHSPDLPLSAVITVPAHFHDAARQATVLAAKEAGIEVLRIINEPTAAALAYSLLPDVSETGQETLVVYDFGGGTFDVSVVHREGLVFNVLSSEGHAELGGDDIDAALAESFLPHIQFKQGQLVSSQDQTLLKNLTIIAEHTKIAFSTNGSVHIYDIDIDGKGSSLDFHMQKDEFNQIIHPILEKTIDLTAKAIFSARKRPADISRIVLVGGSSRLGLVRHLLETRFPKCAVDGRLEPDLAVSWGAALQAAMIMGQNPQTILVDVCSHSLGIGVVEDASSAEKHFLDLLKEYGVRTIGDPKFSDVRVLLGERAREFEEKLQGKLNFAKIISRNSPLPAKKSEFFKTIFANQKAIQVIVAQGEGSTVGDNKFIGSFLFELEQPCEAGTKCEVQLTYDVNGMIAVLARQSGTSNQAQALFDSRSGEVLGWQDVSNAQDTRVVDPAHPTNGLPLLNSFLIKIKNILNTLPLTPLDKKRVEDLMIEYANLLLKASHGAQLDNELEQIELKIIDITGDIL